MKSAADPARRWSVAVAAALAGHGLLAGWLWPRTSQPADAGAAPAAILIELQAPASAPESAPADTAATHPPEPAPPRPPGPAPPPPRRTDTPHTAAPPPPERPAAEATPPVPVSAAAPPPAASEAGAADAPSKPAPDSAAPAVTAEPAAAAAVQRGSTQGRPAAAVAWQSRLLGHLEGFRRYPIRALRQRREGVTYLRFSVDRQGRVGAIRLERGSGSDLLDAEALDVVRRAQPVPAPPPEIEGDPIEVVVPVQFRLRRR